MNSKYSTQQIKIVHRYRLEEEEEEEEEKVKKKNFGNQK